MAFLFLKRRVLGFKRRAESFGEKAVEKGKQRVPASIRGERIEIFLSLVTQKIEKRDLDFFFFGVSV